jgi:hypothetical protein
VHVFWVVGAVGVEVAAEEGFVFEGCGEDFARWEEILVGSWADGHGFGCVGVYVYGWWRFFPVVPMFDMFDTSEMDLESKTYTVDRRE